MYRYVSMLLLFISIPLYSQSHNRKIEYTGIIQDAKSKSPLAGANVLLPELDTGTTTNELGVFTFMLPAGSFQINVSFMGYKTQSFTIHPDNSNREKDVYELEPTVLSAKELSVSAQADDPVINRFEIQAREILKAPAPLPDALLTLKTLPGVSSRNDLSALYSVRGGNFDENLIYVNGFEIHQPQVVRKGIMENPSLVNSEMLQDINLRTGAFSVKYGDKLSSVLDVSYKAPTDKRFAGTVDLSTIGATSATQIRLSPAWSMSLGLRKLNYGYLVGNIQNQETHFTPDYQDVQAVLTWQPDSSTSLQILGLNAESRFHSAPESFAYWRENEGYYKFVYDGYENFDYNTALLAARFQKEFQSIQWNVGGAWYRQRETENTQLDENMLYNYSFRDEPTMQAYDDYRYRYHFVNNQFKSYYYTINSDVEWSVSPIWTIKTGIDVKRFRIYDDLQEEQKEFNDAGTSFLIPMHNYNTSESHNGYLLSQYTQAVWRPASDWRIIPGMRWTVSTLNHEQLFLPRIQGIWQKNDTYEYFASVGRYAQPPLNREFQFRDGPDEELLSQKSWNLTAGLSRTPQQGLTLRLEAYYKSLQDIISYEIEDVQIRYSGTNDARGYVYGLDAFLHGEIVEGTENWFSYSYMVAKEDIMGDDEGYVPRPSDRRHQLSYYMEDRMKKFPNSKMHIRLVYGTGFPFTWKRYVLNYASGEYEYSQGKRNSDRLSAYRRFDAGFTQEFRIGKRYTIILREEVLNVFNNINILGYDISFNRKVDRYLSGRIYNVGCRLVLHE